MCMYMCSTFTSSTWVCIPFRFEREKGFSLSSSISLPLSLFCLGASCAPLAVLSLLFLLLLLSLFFFLFAPLSALFSYLFGLAPYFRAAPSACRLFFLSQLMSEATQGYLKRILVRLATVAWQRRGGLSEDLLRGTCGRMIRKAEAGNGKELLLKYKFPPSRPALVDG